MYTTINGNQFHIEHCLKMGKEAFIAAHKGSVRDVAKVWEQIEKSAPKEDKVKKK